MFVDFLVERLNFDADYMQMLCPDRVRMEAAARAANAEVEKITGAVGAVALPV